MLSTTIFPGRYIQGYNAVERLGPEILRFGRNGFLIGSRTVLEKILPGIKGILDQGINLTTEQLAGEVCEEELGRLQSLAQKSRCDIIIGMGGGKVLDSAKAVASRMNIPVIIVPTIAASDAPCTALTVIYNSRGEFDHLMFLPRNPDVVLVDSYIIAQAPVRFLVAGMGDALSALFEAESCRQKNCGNLTGFQGSMAAYELAHLTYKVVMEYGLLAKQACEVHAVVPALEHIIEANTLLSGLCHESCGAAAAHAINNGFTIFKETHHALHGEKVAFGTLASLFLTDKPLEIIDQVYSFCLSAGLPTTMADIGLAEASDADILKAAETACKAGESIYCEPVPISVQAVYSAIKAADFTGREKKVKRS
jgi:glycerol dehydrogenase